MDNEEAKQPGTDGAASQTAKRFFERAGEVAASGNFDYAIELYCQGLDWDPGALEEGHKQLREVANRRKIGGGKPAGMLEKARLGKRNKEYRNPQFITAIYLLAKDPENVALMEAAVKAVDKLDTPDVCRWLAIMLVEANRQLAKPVFDRYVLAKDVLTKAQAFDQAVVACQLASAMKPLDQGLIMEVKNLSAQQTIKKGRYSDARDFKDSLEDADKQKNLQDDQRAVATEEIIDRQIRESREELQADPGHSGKIFAFVDALLKHERDEEENEAVGVLQAAYDQTSSYRFKQRIGDIRMRQFRRQATAIRAKLHASPSDSVIQQEALAKVRELRQFEEDEYRERVANYPTDMVLRYEFGRRLFDNRKYEDAIPVLQDAERDPKNRRRAISLLGQAFFNLSFFSEAVDTFQRAIQLIETPGDELSKELYYFKGRALEEMGRVSDADAAFSQVMQWDFKYKDVRQRLQALRAQKRPQSAQAP